MSAITTPELKALESAMKDAFDAMGAKLRETQDNLVKAETEAKKYGDVIESKTNDKLGTLGTEMRGLAEQFKTTRDEVLALSQKMAIVPQGGSGDEQKSLFDLIVESDQWKAASKSNRMDDVVVGNLHKFAAKTQIVNATGQNQPLVPDQRVAGIITPNPQRLYIRDLLPQARASSNLIQFASEATFTNSARSQGDASPGNIEGESFAESAMTFTLANAALVTIGHWIPASRQVLSDAAMLQGHISGRLLYGLKLQEETQMLKGTGAAGTINGLNNQAAAFSGGNTNATILDTLLRALLQVSLSNYEASGIVLHPNDWYGAMLLKDTEGRYIFSDPQSMVQPRLWAKPVVPSQTQTAGKFLAGAFDLGAQIWDLEDASVRISENVNDHFIKNLVAILAEERTTLTVYRTSAFVYGDTSYAG